MDTKLTAIEIAAVVKANMPSIGFCSKSQRIHAYSLAYRMIEEYMDSDQELAYEAALILIETCKPFRKASFMTALNFRKIGVGEIDGWEFAKMLNKYCIWGQ